MTVGGAVAVSGLELAGPHATWRLQSGRAAPVRAGDDIVGLFFEGKGAVDYVSVDPVEAPSVMFNARKGSSLKPERIEGGVRLHDSFDRLLWLAGGQKVAPLAGPAAASLEPVFRRHREKFQRVHAPPLSHDFALRALDAPEAALLWAEMDGGREDLLYGFDAMEDPVEAIVTLNSSESHDPALRKYLWMAPLSHQPVGRDRRDPPPPRVLLTDVDVMLEASAGNDAKLTVRETLVPKGRPARALRLNLDRIVYARAGANLEERVARVTGVTDEKGRSLEFDHRLDELIVALAEPAPPDAPLKLRFEIDGDFLVRLRGDNYWELGIRSWFPQPPLSGQAYTFRARVRVPKPFVPFVPGATIRRAEEGGDNVLETKVETPVQFAVILAGKYDMEETVRNGVTIRVATYALDNPRARKQLTSVAAEIIAYYVEFLGPFPFPEFNIVEINDYGFGQAPPATMFITKEAFDPLIGDMSRFEAQQIAKIFAHEIAHQYWGIVVRIPSNEEQWLSESFAEYCAAMFLRDRRSGAVERTVRKRWRSGAEFAAEAAPIPLANRVWIRGDALRRSEIRSGLLYDKGPILLGAIEKEVGPEKFREFLKAVQETYRWKGGSTKSVVAVLQKVTGKDYGPFFEKYYWSIEMPP
ncbi:MAG: M1 family aminopeptidase [Thermoanaerobaculia bacterium]